MVCALLAQKRTIILVLIPLTTCVTTLTMTYMNYEKAHVPHRYRMYYVSSALNYYGGSNCGELDCGGLDWDWAQCRGGINTIDVVGKKGSPPVATHEWWPCCGSAENITCADEFQLVRDDAAASTSVFSCQSQAQIDGQAGIDPADNIKTFHCCHPDSDDQCTGKPVPPEDSAEWLARWVLWHLVFFLLALYKIEVLPRDLWWLPVFESFWFLVVMYSAAQPWQKYPASGGTHVIAAEVVFVTLWFETVMVWQTDKRAHLAFIILLVWLSVGGGDTAGPICSFLGIFWLCTGVPEWLMFVVHVLVVWFAAPRVEKEVQEGKFRPWTGWCHCCCRGLPATTGTGPLGICPPDRSYNESLEGLVIHSHTPQRE